MGEVDTSSWDSGWKQQVADMGYDVNNLTKDELADILATGVKPKVPSGTAAAQSTLDLAKAARDYWLPVVRDNLTGEVSLVHIDKDGNPIPGGTLTFGGDTAAAKARIQDFAEQGLLRNSQGNLYNAQTVQTAINADIASKKLPLEQDVLKGQAADLAASAGLKGQQGKLAGSQADLTLTQQKQLALGTLGTQIAQLKNLFTQGDITADKFNELTNSLVDGMVDRYKQTVEQASAINDFNRTKADMATKLAQTGSAFATNVAGIGAQYKYAPAAGGLMAGMLTQGPAYLKSMMGLNGDTSLTDPSSVFTNKSQPVDYAAHMQAAQSDPNHPLNQPPTPEQKQAIVQKITGEGKTGQQAIDEVLGEHNVLGRAYTTNTDSSIFGRGLTGLDTPPNPFQTGIAGAVNNFNPMFDPNAVYGSMTGSTDNPKSPFTQQDLSSNVGGA